MCRECRSIGYRRHGPPQSHLALRDLIYIAVAVALCFGSGCVALGGCGCFCGEHRRSTSTSSKTASTILPLPSPPNRQLRYDEGHHFRRVAHDPRGGHRCLQGTHHHRRGPKGQARQAGRAHPDGHPGGEYWRTSGATVEGTGYRGRAKIRITGQRGTWNGTGGRSLAVEYRNRHPEPLTPLRSS